MIMNPFLEALYEDLGTFEQLMRQHGLPRAIQERARDARNAITVLQETLDRK